MFNEIKQQHIVSLDDWFSKHVDGQFVFKAVVTRTEAMWRSPW